MAMPCYQTPAHYCQTVKQTADYAVMIWTVVWTSCRSAAFAPKPCTRQRLKHHSMAMGKRLSHDEAGVDSYSSVYLYMDGHLLGEQRGVSGCAVAGARAAGVPRA